MFESERNAANIFAAVYAPDKRISWLAMILVVPLVAIASFFQHLTCARTEDDHIRMKHGHLVNGTEQISAAPVNAVFPERSTSLGAVPATGNGTFVLRHTREPRTAEIFTARAAPGRERQDRGCGLSYARRMSTLFRLRQAKYMDDGCSEAHRMAPISSPPNLVRFCVFDVKYGVQETNTRVARSEPWPLANLCGVPGAALRFDGSWNMDEYLRHLAYRPNYYPKNRIHFSNTLTTCTTTRKLCALPPRIP